MYFDAGIECEHPGFGHLRDLGIVLNVEKDEGGSLAVFNQEIGSLRLQVLQN